MIVGAVIGFPHGNSATESKRYETQLACEDGATEIDMVINIGKALGGEWAYMEQDVKAVCDEAHLHGAKVKVILENDYLDKGGAGLNSDDLKCRLCQLCERAGADWVKTSTGFGFVKQADGSYHSRGATEHDLRLMRESVSEKVQIKAAGGVRNLDALIQARDLGASRLRRDSHHSHAGRIPSARSSRRKRASPLSRKRRKHRLAPAAIDAMKCLKHNAEAVAVCAYCGRALCADCIPDPSVATHGSVRTNVVQHWAARNAAWN